MRYYYSQWKNGIRYLVQYSREFADNALNDAREFFYSLAVVYMTRQYSKGKTRPEPEIMAPEQVEGMTLRVKQLERILDDGGIDGSSLTPEQAGLARMGLTAFKTELEKHRPPKEVISGK